MPDPGEEVRRLQGCVNDLISVLALSAIWSGRGSSHVVETLLDALLGMLRLEFVYVRVSDAFGDPPLEAARAAPPRAMAECAAEIRVALASAWGTALPPSTARLPNPVGAGEVSVARVRLGVDDEEGVLVAASQRGDFPTRTEMLLLQVAANQASIGLREAGLLHEQRRQRRRAEDARRALGALVEHSTDFIGMAIPAGPVLFVNPAGRALVGLVGDDEVRATHVLDYIAVDDRERFATVILPTILREGHWEGETRFRHFRTETAIPMLQNAFVIRDAGADHPILLATISRDISERRRSEEALRDAQTELAHASRLTTMGELAASLAHELNQPLTAVIGNASACLRWLGRDEPDLPEATQAVQRIARDANRAADIMAHTRGLLKKSREDRAPVEMTQAIREILALVHPEVLRHRVLVRDGLAEGLPAVHGDRVQLQQVVLNLVMNGIEAMASVVDRARELAIRSERIDERDGSGVLVSVRDVGIGVAPEHLDRLFQAFYTTKPYGLGMGLSISRSIILAHGGRLWATANPGPGVTVHLVLPFV